ncbi:hypothetical protein HNQ60_003127 [Povalibacter uvarum]|uniref:Uncharacterized protein n=1 Tax=Povalibacter uvarum TaxID=732238 RepID=A0A841HN01_9GAMM|nr:hypothetical protein [Povalibacter uvarum]MBB6094246.1 hypothetical protein [Povalibacter uvarum]
MDREALLIEVGAAFKAVRKPSQSEIAPHECLECDELRVAFAPYESMNIPEKILEKHRWDMPLLSDEAKQYYLSAWLTKSTEEPESDYTDAILSALGADHRWQPATPYTDRQWRLLDAYLEFIASNCNQFDLEHVVQAQLKLEERSPNNAFKRLRAKTHAP